MIGRVEGVIDFEGAAVLGEIAVNRHIPVETSGVAGVVINRPIHAGSSLRSVNARNSRPRVAVRDAVHAIRTCSVEEGVAE